MKTKTLKMGDRIYARLVLNGHTIAEIADDCIAGMTELISALRYRTRRFRGLAQLYVRNLSSGWSESRPLMLYTQRYPTGARSSAGIREAVGYDSVSKWMLY